MKTFKQILDTVYGQAEVNEEQTGFSDYSVEQILAVQFALSEIWEEYDYKFKERSTTFNTVAADSTYDLPYGKIKDKGLKVSTATRPMSEIKNADSLSAASAQPYYYFIESNALNLYPTPDAVYSVTMKYLTDYKAKTSAGVEQDTLESETNVLNIPDYMENHFITTLAYKAALNKIAGPTDEAYVHMASQYAKALNLLIIKSNRSNSGPVFVV
jgi:hypothetical protein